MSEVQAMQSCLHLHRKSLDGYRGLHQASGRVQSAVNALDGYRGLHQASGRVGIVA